jgi:demethoxyubiquinone hydroxylase (CLK1/Coq7/Cat5 family)
MKTEVLFEEANFKIGYNSEAKILHVNWKGEQNVQSIKRGCEKILEFMQARECIKVLNDNTQVHQPWAAVEEFVAVHI